MGIGKKGRRKIDFAGRTFRWFVGDDPDGPMDRLFVISEDKHFVVTYHLGQREESRHLVVQGKEFVGCSETGRVWKRFLCPRWEVEGSVTPAAVRNLLEWCFDPDKELVEVDWQGNRL